MLRKEVSPASSVQASSKRARLTEQSETEISEVNSPVDRQRLGLESDPALPASGHTKNK